MFLLFFRHSIFAIACGYTVGMTCEQERKLNIGKSWVERIAMAIQVSLFHFLCYLAAWKSDLLYGHIIKPPATFLILNFAPLMGGHLSSCWSRLHQVTERDLEFIIDIWAGFLGHHALSSYEWACEFNALPRPLPFLWLCVCALAGLPG